MFRVMRGGTVIGNGLKIKGDVSAEGLVEVNGQIEGDVRCTSLVISPNAQIVGSVAAEKVVVNGRVEGPIQGGDVVLKSKAHVVGDIRHQSLMIEKGAYFEGRAAQTHGANGKGKSQGRELHDRDHSRSGFLMIALSFPPIPDHISGPSFGSFPTSWGRAFLCWSIRNLSKLAMNS